jgi:hypothetical protein
MLTRRSTAVAALVASAVVTLSSPARADSGSFAALGAAFRGGNITLYQTAIQQNGLPLQWAREFWNGSVPASLAAWPAATAANNLGLKLWLSVDMNASAFLTADTDAKLATFAQTLPAGTRLTFMHEPSAKHKGYTAAQYVAAFDHAATVVHAAAPGVLVGPIDVRANVMTRHYLDGLDPTLLDFIAMDAYDGINGGAANQEFGPFVTPQVTYLRTRFPGIPIGFAEFNTARPADDRPRWIADALAWGAANGIEPMCIFDSAQPWILTDAEQQALAALLNPLPPPPPPPPLPPPLTP